MDGIGGTMKPKNVALKLQTIIQTKKYIEDIILKIQTINNQSDKQRAKKELQHFIGIIIEDAFNKGREYELKKISEIF